MGSPILWIALLAIVVVVGTLLILRLGQTPFPGEGPDPDALVLEQLTKHGSDLGKPHDVEFFLYFPDQKSAHAVADRIKEKGFQAEVKPAAGGGDSWLCLATKSILPELAVLRSIRSEFNSIAQAQCGEYDGWGTPIVK